MNVPAGIRLQKFLAAAGVGSRRHCEELIVAGRVRVDGAVVAQLGARVDPERQKVELDGRPVRAEPHRTYLADKPRGILCTSFDPEGRPTIVEWAAQMGADPRLRLYTIGRLDYDSEGLILLTNDGALAQEFAHPRHHVEKEYRAWTNLPPSSGQIAAMLAGELGHSDRDILAEVEFHLERDHLFAYPEMFELLERLDDEGIPFALCSDMYFSSTQILSFLENAAGRHA